MSRWGCTLLPRPPVNTLPNSFLVKLGHEHRSVLIAAMIVPLAQIWRLAARMRVRSEKALVGNSTSRHGTRNHRVAAGCPEQLILRQVFVYEVRLNLPIPR